MVIQQKTGRPVQFEIMPDTRIENMVRDLRVDVEDALTLV